MNIWIRFPTLKPTAVYDTFWRFAAERQEIFFRRLYGEPPPWTKDPILKIHKFTNAYRAADRVSQFLIKNVLYVGEQTPEEIFFRCMLFKIFNRISTWNLLHNKVGEIKYRTYRFKDYDAILTSAKEAGERIFSAAYIMPTHSAGFEEPAKHRNYLMLLEKMMKEDVPPRLAKATSMSGAYEMLLQYPLIGSFLAYQFATDINYSNMTDFSEVEFVVPGPGARDGIRKCFTSMPDICESDIIKAIADQQQQEFARLGLAFRSLWGRPLQLIDCQNLFCEVDKYARIAHPDIKGTTGRVRIKQRFTANSQAIHYWFPPKWGINDLIPAGSTISSIPKVCQGDFSEVFGE